MVLKLVKSIFPGAACVILMTGTTLATPFDIPGGDLKAALDAYAKQAGVSLIVSADAVKGARTSGVKADISADAALARILAGTGFVTRRDSGAVVVMHDEHAALDDLPQMHLAASAVSTASGAPLETVTVTSSKIGGDVQNIPIAITALSQEQLTSQQIAGGPDLVKTVPNLTFTKTNFTGYSIQIRGIGTQAVSVTTDPAVAVAFNDIPFIRNHFFEQEFYDVGQVEVLRGPQGTLYGRNATAGVVNLSSAKPTDQFEMMASADVGNYDGRRFEGMVNVPVIDDRLDIRVAGEWTKRAGYDYNETLQQRIDGRDLWSGRLSVAFNPSERMHTTLVWEHFSEDDDRMRSTKQLCKRDPGPSSVGDVTNLDVGGRAWLSQGCLPTSMYSPDAFETPNGFSIPFIAAAALIFDGNLDGIDDGAHRVPLLSATDPYASAVQSRDLRTIESDITPIYKAKNDVVEFNADYDLKPDLKLISQTGFSEDFLGSAEDFNRFNTAPGAFTPDLFDVNSVSDVTPGGTFCDPQLGCSNRLVGEDLSREHAWQLSQEMRLSSNFAGPFNFSLGGNYLHYETVEDYFVFFNAVTASTEIEEPTRFVTHFFGDPTGQGLVSFGYIDPNPISSLDGNGHNYFRSLNPYVLNSYAGFGEAYYQVASELKLTGGLRWTDDRKHFIEYPSWTLTGGWGYPPTGVIDQQWQKFTGRFVANWTPKLDFTDQTLIYASYSHGYKGGGANPPGPVTGQYTSSTILTHPLTFLPESINAYEAGTKNTALDGAVTINGDVFFYDYTGYQISQIIDRTSVNLNVNATVKGAELESTWEPVPGLRFNLSGGYEDGRIDNGQSAIDLMDRTDGNRDWMVVKPFLSETSNCVLPTTVVEKLLSQYRLNNGGDNSHPSSADPGNGDVVALSTACLSAYNFGLDPGAFQGITTGFDPSTAPNGGAGFTKDLSGNELPNTPHITVSLGAQYSMPITADWAATLRGDFYYQSDSWARIFNDNPYDRIRGYTNVNLALILTSQDGWQAMGYMKNVFNTTAITGAFLNSDDTALTTNVFVTDPRLFGVRLTKNW